MTVPLQALVLDHFVLDPWLMAPLMPGIVAAVTEHHLIGSWAVHTHAFLAKGLFHCPLYKLIAFLRIIFRRWIIGVGLQYVSSGFRSRRRGGGRFGLHFLDAFAIVRSFSNRGGVTNVFLSALPLLRCDQW